jgi:hypothetical protein
LARSTSKIRRLRLPAEDAGAKTMPISLTSLLDWRQAFNARRAESGGSAISFGKLRTASDGRYRIAVGLRDNFAQYEKSKLLTRLA